MTQADDTSYRTLTLDVERYQAMLDTPGLSDQEQAAMVETLWQLVVGFIDLDFQIVVENNCGKLTHAANGAPTSRTDVVKSDISNMNGPFAPDFFKAANMPHKPRQTKEAS